MGFNLMFFVNSILLGAGLAMDAFSVSLASGLNEPKMKWNRMSLIAGTFGVFQAVMPMIGWICVHTLISYFKIFEKFVPWIALGLLLFIGGKMLIEGIKGGEQDDEKKEMSFKQLMIMGVATSIDALSVGFTIAEYNLLMAVTAAIIIAIVTFVICVFGLIIGKKVGTKLAGKASILGGIILIGIGLEIFISSFFK